MTHQITHPDRQAERPATAGWPLYAAVSTGVSLVLTAIGTFWSPLADYEATQTREDLIGWLVVAAITVVAAAIVFGLVVRTAPAGGGRTRALVLVVLAVLTLVVFWTGLPLVLAGGAACCAMGAPRATWARIVLVIAGLVTALAVFAALAG